MQRRVLTIGLHDFDVQFINDNMSDSFEFVHVWDFEEAKACLSSQYRLIKLILIDRDAFCDRNYRIVQRLQQNPVIGLIPLICVGTVYETEQEHIQDECLIRQQGAVDFFSRPFVPELLKARMKGIIHLREIASLANLSVKRDATRNYDKGTYWTPNSLDSIIMHAYVGAAFILESIGEHVAIIRANDRMVSELLGDTLYAEEELADFLAVHMDDRNKRIFLEALQQAYQITGEEVICELILQEVRQDQPVMHVCITLRLIDQAGNRGLFYGTLINNTKQYEAVRRETAMMKQLQIVVENFPNGITVSYDDFLPKKYLYANDQFYTIFGYTREEFESELPKALQERILPQYLPAVHKTFFNAAKNGEEAELIYEAKKRDGSVIWVRSHSKICFVDEKRQPAYITFYEDISKMKKAEEKIQLINERLGNSEIVLQLDLTHQTLKSYHSIYESEKGLEKRAYITYEELCEARIYQENRANVVQMMSCAHLLEYFDAGETRLSVKYRRCMDSGEVRWFSATAVLIQDTQRGTVDAFIYAHDIDLKTKKRLAKDRIIDTDIDDITIINIASGYSQVVQLYGGSVITLGKSRHAESVQLFVNQEVAKEDAERCREFFALENLVATVKKNGYADISYWRNAEDGSVRRKNNRITYLDSTKEDLLMVGRDITMMFEWEQEQKMALQHAAELANYANQAKSEFLSRMSHDMRTPLNAILGLVSLAKIERSEEVVDEYLEQIHHSGQFLLELVNDTLDLSKIESGKLELHRGPFPLQEFVQGIHTVIKPLMDEKKIRFEVNLQEQEQNIAVDRVRFNQIFYNLLSNAAKYTPEGGHVEFWSEPIPAKNGKFGMQFHVRDSGIGMSAEYQKVLFDPFTQEFTPAHEEQKGTGLGLAIVKQIVDLAEGQIRVISEVGKGTEFIVDMYAYRTEDAAEKQTSCEYDSTRLHGIRVLLVDDTEINTTIVKKILEYKGCMVEVARNGQEGVRMFDESKEGYYRVILTDIRMPVMDGMEEARRIRALNRADAKAIPIIAATADAYSDMYEKIIESGMNTRLVKPIQPELLCATIVRYLGEQQ